MSPLQGLVSFGDVRRAERGAWLFGQIVAAGSLVLRKVGGDRAGEIAAHRFLDSPQVTAGEIIEALARRTAEACRGRQIMVAQDTTEINFSGRARARRGLGPAGNGKAPGFFVHAAVAIDVADEAVVGLLEEAAAWTRRGPGHRPPHTRFGAEGVAALVEHDPTQQTHAAARLFQLAALAIGAAVSTIQLVDTRDGGERPGSKVAEPEVLEAAAAIGPTLAGKTWR